MKPLLSVRSGLQRHKLESDLLVYDPSADVVHLLNPTAATVFAQIASGSTQQQIIDQLNAQATESASGEDLYDIALDELNTAGLLAESQILAQRGIDPTRRQALQRIATVGAGILIPAVLTLAPRLYAQGSGRPLGADCDLSAQCASGCCQQGNAAPCVNKTCVNPAASCAVCR